MQLHSHSHLMVYCEIKSKFTTKPFAQPTLPITIDQTKMSFSSVSYSEPNNKEIGSLKQSEQKGTPTDTAGDAAHGTYGTANGLPRKGPSKDPGLFGGG
ncbi:hypothetical protein G7K_2156-t1 [Saitoella complicata NRRL Y-17804]|uniref:Uncharacterized protein n=1 Tax=Saitoella complicata (strain BCRC 22490 / CBS 7301 / JCM 7358 / NBRC 10748 / NRRL Y-17804) TaxID=698492 RepID=A0A0E9NDN6_SAICN|nr:hypothetical protein G7K_2156-t1 [Saitoella complicata NRRL Y-17804]